MLQVLRLGPRAVVERVVAMGDTGGGMGDVIGAIAHLGHHVAQLRVHLGERREQAADLVLATDLDARAERAARRWPRRRRMPGAGACPASG